MPSNCHTLHAGTPKLHDQKQPGNYTSQEAYLASASLMDCRSGVNQEDASEPLRLVARLVDLCSPCGRALVLLECPVTYTLVIYISETA